MPAVRVGAIEIEYEEWGDADAAPAVLIAGLGAQLIMWPMGLVHTLGIAGHRVVRFDNRDAGLSTHFAGKLNLSHVAEAIRRGDAPDVPYLLADMADDTAGLMEELGIAAGHLVGISMGAAIAQEVAIRHPSIVRSLTCIMGTTGASDVGQPTATGNRALFKAPPPDRQGAIATSLASAELLASHGHFDAARAAIDSAWSYDRAFDPEGVGRQLGAIWASPDRTPALHGLAVPTLALHGGDDPLIPPSGGRAIAAAVPGARYVEIEGMAHDLNERFWPDLLRPLLAHLSAA